MTLDPPPGETAGDLILDPAREWRDTLVREGYTDPDAISRATPAP